MLFFLMMLLMRLTNLPDWVLPSLGVPLFLLCLLNYVLLVLTGSSGNLTSQVKGSRAAQFCHRLCYARIGLRASQRQREMAVAPRLSGRLRSCCIPLVGIREGEMTISAIGIRQLSDDAHAKNIWGCSECYTSGQLGVFVPPRKGA